jgi:methionyl aminopeptidase
MDRGDLVPDDLILEIVEERLSRDDARAGFVLDGFPRTIPQAEGLDRMMGQRGWKLDRVVAIEVSEETVIARNTGRWVCPKDGAVYHVVTAPPRRSVRAACRRAGLEGMSEVELKGAAQLAVMRRAGKIVWEILQEMAQLAKPGSTTAEIDRLAEVRIREKGAKAAFKGYKGSGNVAFPSNVCISINQEVVHGIPSKQRTLRDGDIVSLDFGVSFEGYFADSAITVPVGAVSEEAKRLIRVTREAMQLGIAQTRAGNRLHDIGSAVQAHVEANGFAVVRDFVGHGIGRKLHEAPQIPNYGSPGTGMRLREGMVLAIEPMVNAGTAEVQLLSDGWTAVTADGQLSAHFEHSVAVGGKGPDILTLPEGMEPGREGEI